MRLLYYVPILHTQEEMGLPEVIARSYGISKHTQELVTRIRDFMSIDVDTYWSRLSYTVINILRKEQFLKDSVTPRAFHIFSDSLVEGESGFSRFKFHFPCSPHVRIIEKLVSYGGIVHDTESAEKHQACVQSLQCGLNNCVNLTELVSDRDRYIAQNINEKLKENEHAILFMGAMHNVPQYIPQSIKVKVIHRADVFTSRLKKMPQVFKDMLLSGPLGRPDNYGHSLSPNTS